jgi:hypothetical protein
MGDPAAGLKCTDAEVARFSPIRFVSSGSGPSPIVHGDADTDVPIDQGQMMLEQHLGSVAE